MPHGLPTKIRFQRPDEVSDLEWLLLEIQRIEGCEATKAQVLKLVKTLAGRVIRFTHKVLTRPDQVQRARELLEAGNLTSTVRDRLCAAYGCCPRTAYNLIQAALNQRGAEHTQALRRAQQDFFAPAAA